MTPQKLTSYSNKTNYVQPESAIHKKTFYDDSNELFLIKAYQSIPAQKSVDLYALLNSRQLKIILSDDV